MTGFSFQKLLSDKKSIYKSRFVCKASVKMKLIAVLAVLGLASQCLAAPAFDDEFEKIFNETLDYVLERFGASDSGVAFNSFKGKQIQIQDLNVTLDMSNIKLSKFNDHKLQGVQTDPKNLTATVNFNMPEVLLAFNYIVNGFIHNKYAQTVSYSNYITIQGLNSTLTFNVINPNTSLAVSHLDVDYDFDLFTIQQNGLSISGMSTDQVQQFVTQRLFRVLISDEIKNLAAGHLREGINKIFDGMTVDEYAYFLKGWFAHKK